MIGILAQLSPRSGIGGAALLFLLLPGIVFVKAVMIARRRVADLSRFDQLGYALAGGAGSLLALVVAWRAVGGAALALDALAALPLSAVLVSVAVQSALAAASGYGWGVYLRRRSDVEPSRTWDDRHQPWEYASEKLRRMDIVTVVTADGREVRGVVARYGSGNVAPALVLASPKVRERVDGEVRNEYRMGNETYLSADDVSEIHWEDDEYRVDDAPPGAAAAESDEVLTARYTDRVRQWFRRD